MVGAHLVLLLPPIEVAGELISYSDIARANFTVLCETSATAVARAAEDHFGPTSTLPILQLEVTALRCEDGWTFVQARLANCFRGGIPGITKEVVDQYMAARIDGRGKATIREIQFACERVFDWAIATLCPK